MQLQQILSRLSKYRPVTVQMSKPRVELLGLRISSTDSPDDDRLLSVCSKDEYLTDSRFLQLHGTILICGCPAADLLDSVRTLTPSANIIALDTDSPIEELRSDIDYIFLQEQRLATGLQVLLRAQVEDQGAQRVVEEAYRVLKNPIFISNISNRYIASVYDEETFDPNGPFAGFILDDIMYGYVSQRGKDFIHRNKLDELLQKDSSPHLIHHSTFDRDVLFAAIRVQNISVGRIFMVAVEHPFTDLDIQLFSALVTIINGLITQKGSELSFNHLSPDSACLSDLLSSSYADDVILKRCTSLFNFKPGSSFLLAVSPIQTQERNRPDPNVLVASLKFHFPSCPASIVQQRIAVLFPTAEQALPEAFAEQLDDFCCRNSMSFGFSNVFSDLAVSHSEFLKASRAADLAANFLQDSRLVYFKDVVMYELMTHYQRSHKLVDLVAPEIQQLLSADSKNNGEYINTLSAYLKYFGRSRKICEELHIHKNTLLYRLERLKSVYGLDLDNGDAQLRYHLSLLILKTLNSTHHFLPDHIIL